MIFPSFHWPYLFIFQLRSKILRDSDTWENKKCISLLSIEFSFWSWCKYRVEIQQGTEASRKLGTNTILQCLCGGIAQHCPHCLTCAVPGAEILWLDRAESKSWPWAWVRLKAWGLVSRLIERQIQLSFCFIGLWTSLRLSGPTSFAQQRVWMLFQYTNWNFWIRRIMP